MRDLDKLLARLPAEMPQNGLPEKIRTGFRRRRRRLLMVKGGVSTVLVLWGGVMLAPWIDRLLSLLRLPDNGLAFWQSAASLPGVTAAAAQTYQGAAQLQNLIGSSMGLFEGVGLAALAAGAALGLNALLPGRSI